MRWNPAALPGIWRTSATNNDVGGGIWIRDYGPHLGIGATLNFL